MKIQTYTKLHTRWKLIEEARHIEFEVEHNYFI